MSSLTFAKLSTIQPEDAGTHNRFFLTIDVDWAHDEVICDTIDLLEKAKVEATWFITHKSKMLDRLRANQKFELGIHPNFNFLLAGDARNGNDMRQVIEKLLEIVPEATSLRSHSLCTSTKLLQLMPEYGLTHESNLYLPNLACPQIPPFRILDNIVRIPHSFEDDAFLLSPKPKNLSFSAYMRKYIQGDGVKVLDFHPIHVFLNTEHINRYEQTRSMHAKPDELISHRYTGEGIRNALEVLLGLQ